MHLSPAVLSNLKAYLSRFVTLSEAEFEQFCGQLTPKKLKRKEVLLRQGEVCKQVAFISQGCLRYFYLVDGQEHTGQFFFENSFYTDYESFLSGEPSRQNVGALEKTELLLLRKTDLYKLYEENPKFERFGRLMAEQAYLGVRKRNTDLLNLSPEDRYRELLSKRPKVMTRIPQHYIASYLGIKPQSLSRIRKRILADL
jgi:CRP-like cAMP-binding protein